MAPVVVTLWYHTCVNGTKKVSMDYICVDSTKKTVNGIMVYVSVGPRVCQWYQRCVSGTEKCQNFSGPCFVYTAMALQSWLSMLAVHKLNVNIFYTELE